MSILKKNNQNKAPYCKVPLRILLILMVLIFAISNVSCNKRVDDYTEAEHMQMVTDRIRARYIDGDERLLLIENSNFVIYPKIKATDFEIFPLYDENEALKCFLVEFQPVGFLYVLVSDEIFDISKWITGRYQTKMYILSSEEGERAWTKRYLTAESDDGWEKDENGEKVMRYHSPFFEANIQNEKRYLITYDYTYIPAVKRGDKYINLYSDSEFEIVDGSVSNEQIVSNGIHFFEHMGL